MSDTDSKRQRLPAFLRGPTFVVLTWNGGDPSIHGPFEAWAYRGPLDLATAEPVKFGVGENPIDAITALGNLLTSKEAETGEKGSPTLAHMTDRELATILAALRFHQDENLQGGRDIPDQPIKEIITDSGLLKPLSFEEVSKLCERLNLNVGSQFKGLVVEPPHKEGGDQPLFRVVYVIDVNATSPLDAAGAAHRIMSDPDSQPPVLEIIDHRGKAVSIDLSEEAPA